MALTKTANPPTPPLIPDIYDNLQPQHLLVDVRSGNMKLNGFGRAGLWDLETEHATDLAYARIAPRLTHAAPEVRDPVRQTSPAARPGCTPAKWICARFFSCALLCRPGWEEEGAATAR